MAGGIAGGGSRMGPEVVAPDTGGASGSPLARRIPAWAAAPIPVIARFPASIAASPKTGAAARAPATVADPMAPKTGAAARAPADAAVARALLRSSSPSTTGIPPG